MKKWALHFLILSFIMVLPYAPSAFENRRNGARSAALSHASVAIPGSEAIWHNTAGISFEQKLTIALSHESRFLLKELSLMAAGFIIPTRSGTFGGSFTRFGTGSYGENRIGIACSKLFGPSLSGSIQFIYLSEKFPENRTSFSAFTFECGILTGDPRKFMAGIYLFNPCMAKMKTFSQEKRIPFTISIGNSWMVAEGLMLCGELEKTLDIPLIVKTGIEYSIRQEVILRAGVSGSPLKFTGGAGWNFKKVHFDIAFSHDLYLGFTPVAGIIFMP